MFVILFPFFHALTSLCHSNHHISCTVRSTKRSFFFLCLEGPCPPVLYMHTYPAVLDTCTMHVGVFAYTRTVLVCTLCSYISLFAIPTCTVQSLWVKYALQISAQTQTYAIYEFIAKTYIITLSIHTCMSKVLKYLM